jgi:hypothetical protein
MPATPPRAALLATAVAVALSLLPASAALADGDPIVPLHPRVLVPDPPVGDGPAEPATAPAATAPQADVLMTTDGLDADPLVRAQAVTPVATMGRVSGRGAVVRVTLDAPRGTRVARLVLRGSGGSASQVVRVRAGGTLRLRWELTRAQTRHVGAAPRLAVSVGARRSSLSTAWSGGVRVPLGS